MSVYCNDCKYFKLVKGYFEGRRICDNGYWKNCTEGSQTIPRNTPNERKTGRVYANNQIKNANNDCSAYVPSFWKLIKRSRSGEKC